MLAQVMCQGPWRQQSLQAHCCLPGKSLSGQGASWGRNSLKSCSLLSGQKVTGMWCLRSLLPCSLSCPVSWLEYLGRYLRGGDIWQKNSFSNYMSKTTGNPGVCEMFVLAIGWHLLQFPLDFSVLWLVLSWSEWRIFSVYKCSRVTIGWGKGLR